MLKTKYFIIFNFRKYKLNDGQLYWVNISTYQNVLNLFIAHVVCVDININYKNMY